MKYAFAFIASLFVLAGVEYDAVMFGPALLSALASVDYIVGGR